jgi:hypothetical protein
LCESPLCGSHTRQFSHRDRNIPGHYDISVCRALSCRQARPERQHASPSRTPERHRAHHAKVRPPRSPRQTDLEWSFCSLPLFISYVPARRIPEVRESVVTYWLLRNASHFADTVTPNLGNRLLTRNVSTGLPSAMINLEVLGPWRGRTAVQIGPIAQA